MNLDRITEAADAVGWLSTQAGTMGNKDCAEMAMLLTIARSYLLEYAHHMAVGGIEPYDALLATARGELKIPQRIRDLMTALKPPPATA